MDNETKDDNDTDSKFASVHDGEDEDLTDEEVLVQNVWKVDYGSMCICQIDSCNYNYMCSFL